MKILFFILLFSFSIFSEEEKKEISLKEKLTAEFKKNEFTEEEQAQFYKRLESMGDEEFIQHYPFVDTKDISALKPNQNEATQKENTKD